MVIMVKRNLVCKFILRDINVKKYLFIYNINAHIDYDKDTYDGLYYSIVKPPHREITIIINEDMFVYFM